MKKQIRIYIYIIGLILIDQLSKVWALSALRGTEGIAVIPNVFELSYLENRGAAFGILQDHQIFFVLITVAAAVILTWIYRRIPQPKKYIPLRISYALIMTSRTDITEAFNVGGAAVKAAFEGETGKVVVLKRVSDDPYMCITETHDVHQIANIEKKVPLEWITEDDFVTEDLIHYIRPLIQAELSPIMVDGLPRHLNVNMD